jgi:ankyrin repeat protein
MGPKGCKSLQSIVALFDTCLHCFRFRWVSLQIQNLCDSRRIKVAEDISEELVRLPKSLVESYEAIYRSISNSGSASRTIAGKVLRWLICAQRPLKSQELIAAVSVDSQGAILGKSIEDLLDMCCNLVVLDLEMDVFRFAHLSVREYLESREEYTLSDAHALALERCLDAYTYRPLRTPAMDFIVQQNNIFRPYSTLYWPVHCQSLQNTEMAIGLRERLHKFLFQDFKVSSSYTEWVSTARESCKSLQWDDSLNVMLRAASSSPPTPLFLACSFGLLSIMGDQSAYRDVNWNQRNDEGHTGLHLAAIYGHEMVMRVALENGAEIALKDGDGRTALHWAAKMGQETIVRLLLENGMDVAVKDDYGVTALHVAAATGQAEVIRILLERGADIGADDNDRGTALHWAVRNRREEVVQLLLEEGADIEAKDKRETALHLALKDKQDTMMQRLLDNGADIEAKNSTESTVLHRAAQRGEDAIVQLLLERGASTTVQNKYGFSALHNAAWKGHNTIVQMLFEHGVGFDLKDENGWKVQLVAALNGHEAVLQQLEVNVEANTGYGLTAQYQVPRNELEAVEWILANNGIDNKVTGQNPWTPLHLAAEGGNKVAVQRLLDGGIDIEAKDLSGWTALHRASCEGNNTVVRLLLEKGAEIEARNGNGSTALTIASQAGHKEVVGLLLLDQGVDVNLYDNDGDTPLILASWKGHIGIVELLLQIPGLDVHRRNKSGYTAISRARQEARSDILALFHAKGYALTS